MINYDLETFFADTIHEKCCSDENRLIDVECPECQTLDSCEFTKDKDGEYDGDSYCCCICGHEGSIQQDEDERNYYDAEVLCGYDESEKGEVNDKNI